MIKKHNKTYLKIGVFTLILISFTLFSFQGKNAEIHIEKNTQTEASENSEAIENPEKSRAKADFGMHLKNSKGEVVSLEDYRGKVIFINFWATWCPPCIAEMPSIQAMYKDIDKSKIEVLMVSFDRNFTKAIDYKTKNNFDFEVYEPAGAIPGMYNTRSIPTTYIIDSEGNLAFSHIGMADYNREDFKEFLNSL